MDLHSEITQLREAERNLRILIIVLEGKIQDIIARIPNYQVEYVQSLKRQIHKAEDLLERIQVRLLFLD